MNWLIVSAEDQLDALNERSFDTSVSFVLLFKDSPRCIISTMAKDRIERKWEEASKIPACYINVLLSRAVSNEVAKQYGVEHQSPQILLIKEGKCIYTASHSDISFEQIREFL